MRIFYLLLSFVLFPFNCQTTESQLAVVRYEYTVEKDNSLCFFQREEVGDPIDQERMEQRLKDENLLFFLKAKMTNPSQRGSFCYAYFCPAIVFLKKNNLFFTYPQIFSRSINFQEFPTKEVFKEIFKKQKETVINQFARQQSEMDKEMQKQITDSLFAGLLNRLQRPRDEKEETIPLQCL
jgi:hypothetical protein